MNRWKLRTKLMAGFGLVLTIVALQSAIAFRATTANATATEWTDHTHLVIAKANEALTALVNMETGYRGFLVTGRDVFLEPYTAGQTRSAATFAELSKLTADNPAQVARWKELQDRARAWEAEITSPGMELRRRVESGGATQQELIAFETSGKGKQHFDGMRKVFADAIGAEESLLATRSAENARAATRLLFVLVGGTLLVIALGMVIAYLLAGRISRSVNVLAQAATAMARGELDVVLPTQDGDEIGDLAHSFERMVAAQRSITASATAIAAGNVSVAIEPRSEKDVLGHAFVGLRTTLASLVQETAGLVTAAQAGNLSTRGDATAFSGAYHDLVQGINATLDAVVEPINESAIVLGQIADQNLRARVTGAYRGDLARIKDSINTAATTLEAALGQVSLAAVQTASAGQQIAATSQSLAQGASEQAASLEEVTGSLHLMLASTGETATNALEARRKADDARERVAEGTRNMQRLSDAITSIKTSSDQTAKIVRTIDEIAFQTNLLALNAAVEAARAGDAGRGFAVVAEEVRSLAIRSAEAAKTTATLIEESVQSTTSGVLLNAEVTASLDEIGRQVREVSDVVGLIATTGEAQNRDVRQISDAITQLNTITQQVAANAEESASASEELASQSSTLTAMIDGFQLGSAPGAADPVVDGTTRHWRRPPASRGVTAQRSRQPAPAFADV